MSRAYQARHIILLIAIDIDRSQPSNNVVVMEGEYISVESDGNLTTNFNWGQEQKIE